MLQLHRQHHHKSIAPQFQTFQGLYKRRAVIYLRINPFLLIMNGPPPPNNEPRLGVLILGSPSKVVLASLAGEF